MQVHKIESPPLLTLKEAAAMAQLDPRTVKAGIESGGIPSVKFGARVLIPREAFERILRGELTAA